MRKKIAPRLIVVLTSILSVASCEDLFMTEFTFKNESGYTVNVSPSGHDDFTLTPGSSRSVKTKSTSLMFIYSPADRVKTNLSGVKGNTVRFVNAYE